MPFVFSVTLAYKNETSHSSGWYKYVGSVRPVQETASIFIHAANSNGNR